MPVPAARRCIPKGRASIICRRDTCRRAGCCLQLRWCREHESCCKSVAVGRRQPAATDAVGGLDAHLPTLHRPAWGLGLNAALGATRCGRFAPQALASGCRRGISGERLRGLSRILAAPARAHALSNRWQDTGGLLGRPSFRLGAGRVSTPRLGRIWRNQAQGRLLPTPASSTMS